ncbi:MAG: FHA domain-containing protein [Aulosira sp. ZfuVER01]|nr:FHA domain-containing protein [Aulosira sp. ZfuVER01]MDZ7997184.1 FHA domain-containing protein [Aulosira sp. DedVER01a]MDZ8056041.1 FHA domain-containing protein [Aulosira sp. ZfuCHP01]
MNEISKSHFLPVKGSSMMAELQGQELQRRLSLFQVFLKLYEQHSSLLDDILQLENLTQTSLDVNQSYVQGVIDGSTVYVITNLCDNKTQSLQQPQQIWTIGRDDSNGIYIADRYLSDRHAAIQYIDHQGFYLIDFKSTNGSFVNGELVYQPTKLNDGDRIRLGMITFDFFINHTCRTLPTVAVELLMQLVPGNIFNSTNTQQRYQTENLNESLHITRDSDLIDNLKYQHSNFSVEEKSEILDRFFSRHQPDHL